MEELEQKIKQSLEEGYEKQEIIEVMQEQGYSKHKIGKALAHLND
ncbi:hypothetical protein [Candidatus Nanohalobium constans]|nr:hypothetical protein [Candidatus Nanohalobium constans]